MAHRQKILMCEPTYFGVNYVINPWMTESIGKTDTAKAQKQWRDLRKALADQTNLTFIAPENGLPDMVFTANAGMVLGNKVVLSRFKSKERQGEELYFKIWFAKRGYEILPWPKDVPFEGAGDALFDRRQELIWVGHGFRSSPAASKLLERLFQRRTVPLRLVDPRFYHLDTCFCPLENGHLIYYPPAFDAASQAAIKENLPPEKRIVIGEEDALNFACNAVELNKNLYMNYATQELQDHLRMKDFTPVIVPLTEFLKAGGTAKCLTLKLVEE